MKIAFINMPFAPLESPSFALTQLAAAVREQLGSAVCVKTHYLNLDFGAATKCCGFYDAATSPYARISGLADWFFRPIAFPDAPDNTAEYLARYYFDDGAESRIVNEFTAECRQAMPNLLDEWIEKYALGEMDVIGFTLNFSQTVASIAMANRLKKHNPEIIIVFGGSSVRGVPGVALINRVAAVDYIFSGPALIGFLLFVKALAVNGKTGVPTIKGLLTAGVSRDHPQLSLVGDFPDINALVKLDYNEFLRQFRCKADGLGQTPYLLLQSSRGCRWADRERCTFCGLNPQGETFAAMTPEVALKHLQSVLAYAGDVAYFVACDNMIPPEYFANLFPRLQVPQKVFIKYETRADLTAGQMRTLCRAGVRCVQPGIEALSTEVLRLMRKGMTAFNNIRFLKDALECRLAVEWNILIGSPGERHAILHKYQRDIPLLVHLPPPQGVFPVEVVRDSYYFDHAKEFGLQLEAPESMTYIYPFNRETLFDLSLRFTDISRCSYELDRWLDRLNLLVRHRWRERWEDAAQETPRLIMWCDQQSAIIYDSRSLGDAAHYRISEQEERVLMVLDKPAGVEEVARRCELDAYEAKRVVCSLVARGLLFEEKERFLSLVTRP